MPDDQRPINPYDLEMLQRACGVQIPQGVAPDAVMPPDKVVATYWKFKRVLDRLDAGNLSPQTIAVIVLLSGFGEEIPAVDSAPVLVPQLLEQGDIKRGSPVLAKWRGKEVEGKLVGVTADKRKVLVQFPGDAEVREIPPTDVKVPELAA